MTHSFPTRRYSDLTGKRVSLSSEANHGLCQLINYIDRSARSQAYLRDDLKLAGFREPREVLMIGTEEESRDERVSEFKGAWNRMNPRVQIRSYSALLRQLADKEIGRASCRDRGSKYLSISLVDVALKTTKSITSRILHIS